MSDAGDIAERVYVIRDRDSDYFVGWQGTEWETVKRFALWTKNVRDAAQIKMKDLQRSGYMDLVCGFSGLKLLPL
ncbi:MAG TPA: hypothetical protein VGK91_09540 [Candidatus Udaeobacter sp.]|jgi:hypothetical protein